MNKICFQEIVIEVNRQCNFRCEHCYCGENEGFFDFNYEKLELLLDQTLAISHLEFLGGEPTLSLKTMDNIMNMIEQKNIPICYFSMATNGSCDIKLFKSFIIRVNKYMNKFLSKPINAKDCISIQISDDYYHRKFIDCKAVYNQLLKEVGEYCSLLLNNRGETTEKKGRAEKLNYSGESTTANLKECKIPYFIQGRGIDKIYRCSENITFDFENQILIPCKIVFGNDGKLYNGFRSFMPYKNKDEMTGVTITDNLLQSLDTYNQNVPVCCEIKSNYDNDEVMIGYLHHNKEMFIKDMKENGYEVKSLFSDNDRKALDDVILCLHKCVEGYKSYAEDKMELSRKMSEIEAKLELLTKAILK